MVIGQCRSIGAEGQWSYSMTMQSGRCWEKYLKSSAVAPGQLVSSSSSSSCSCMSPERPLVVSRGQPEIAGETRVRGQLGDGSEGGGAKTGDVNL